MFQDKNVKRSIDTYIYELGGGLHAGVKGPNMFPLDFGIDGRCHVSANVISGLDKVWIVPQGLCNTRVLSRLFLGPWHRWAFTSLWSTMSPESKRLRNLWGYFLTLNRI
jgi:hypothetical protein